MTKICVVAGDVDRTMAIEVVQHSFRSRSTASTVAGSALLRISAATPLVWIVIATDAVSQIPMEVLRPEIQKFEIRLTKPLL